LSLISASSRNVASGADQVTLKRSLRMHTSKTAITSAAYKMRSFGAVHSAACACIGDENVPHSDWSV